MNQQFMKNSLLWACLNRAMRMSALDALFTLPPIHTGCGLILGREGMVVDITVSGPLSCTSQMFDFIRALSICRVRSEDVAELEDI